MTVHRLTRQAGAAGIRRAVLLGVPIEGARALKRLREDNAALDARVVQRAMEIGELKDRLAEVQAQGLPPA